MSVDQVIAAARSGLEAWRSLDWTPPVYVLPGWRLERNGGDGQAWLHDGRQQSLIWSVSIEQDGRPWLHVSIAHPDRLPTWAELVEAKEWIAGTTREGYQVIPARSRYVNQHPFALHVFVPLGPDTAVLPDFTRGTDTL